MSSSQENLRNLQKIGKLKAEPPDQVEFDGLVASAERKLTDAENPTLSPDSRFSLAYDVAHSFALAALRWHGFRSENRYIVFYEGNYSEDEQLIKELIAVSKELRAAVKALGPVVGS